MKKILFIGQLTDNSGYGNAARNYVSTLSKLHESGGIELSLLNFSFELNSSIGESEKEMIRKYSLVDHGDFKNKEKVSYFTDENVKKIKKYLKDNKDNFYIVGLLIPSVYTKTEADDDLFFESGDFQQLNVRYVIKYSAGIYPGFVWEFDNIPDKWKESFKLIDNKIVKFISACQWNKEVIESCTGKESSVIPYTSKPQVEADKIYTDKIKNIIQDRYAFCMIGQFNTRKGYDILFKSFYTEFKDEDVVLIVKCYTNEVQYGSKPQATSLLVEELIRQVKKLITSYGEQVKDYKCKVVVIPGILTEQEISSIYKASDCMITCTRGEGFGLPLADFLVNHSKPLISPSLGGHLDFVDPDSPLIDSRYEPYLASPSKFHSSCDMNFVEPSILSARKQMRKLYEIGNNSEEYKELSKKMHKYAKEYLSMENNIKMFKEVLEV
jgi:glycosyltransferase involved in cell wall biosynthesis